MKMKDIVEKNCNFHLMFENHNSIMLVIDPDSGYIIEANKEAIKYYGYTKDKLLSMRIQDINILSENQTQLEMNNAILERKNYFQFTHRLVNNELREVEAYSFPINMGKRKVLYSIIHDISDKYIDKLMFDKLFFASPYGVAILDKEQKITNINRNFSALFHYSFEEAIGKTITDLVSPIDEKTNIDNNIILIYKGEIVKQEVLRKRKDGKLIEVELLGYPIIVHQKVVGVYIMYIDISHKKAYEKQLLLFRKIFENNSEGIVITDNAGHVEWVNNAFKVITGYSLSY